MTLTKTSSLWGRKEKGRSYFIRDGSARKSCTNGDIPGGVLPVYLIAIEAYAFQDPGDVHRS